jgi:hypothetical protein
MAYKGFISYSHAADGRLAPAVQHALHRIAKPWYRLRTMRLFRDQTNLGASPGLWHTIETALQGSEFFLFMASPGAAQSPWVQKEVHWWLTNRASNTFLIVLTDGRIGWHEAKNDFDWANTTALPPQLAKAFSQFRAAILEMAATLLDRSKDELDGDDVRQHRRTRRLAWSGVAILAVLFFVAASAGYIALQQRNVAMQRFADLCKALSESQVLSDASNHGSVYHFQSEYAAIKDQCTELGYQPW